MIAFVASNLGEAMRIKRHLGHIAGRPAVAAALVTTLLIGLTTSLAHADEGSVNSAYRICALMDASGLGSQPCDVSGWGSSVDLYLDMDAGEARKLCPQIAGLARDKGWRFQDGWTLKIYSPYSGDNTIAYCRL